MRKREKNEALIIRLEIWGEWRVTPVPVLYYPGSSPEGRLMELGAAAALGARTKYRAAVPAYNYHPREIEVDKAIADLPHDCRVAMMLRYVEGVRDQYKASERMGISRKTWNVLMTQAHMYVAGRLGLRFQK